ncbi:MAG: phytoene desaturase family protein, partial [Flavobacteriales bacterium]
MKKHAVVIGSGIGGLASAIRLAHAGFDVSVYEKNAVLGGKVHSKTLGAYRFDMGPSVFTEPHLVDELLGLASKPVSFSYSLLPESCRYFFSDGQQIVLKSGTSGTKASLTNDLNEDPIAVESYLERISKNYRLLRPVFIESS